MTIKYVSTWLGDNYLNESRVKSKLDLYIFCDISNEQQVLNVAPVSSRRILLIVEPPNIMPEVKKFALKNFQMFWKIITFDQQVLDSCPNAVFLEYGTKWIHINENIDTSIKKFQMSSVTGLKNFSDGHRFRINLYNNKGLITGINHTAFLSSRSGKIILMPGPVLGDFKDELFTEYQYSLVIENTKMDNYFSEKLIDCLLSKSIPVYYGAPNISSFFDTDYFVILDSDDVNSAYNKINELTEDNYQKHTEMIDANFIKAKYYADYRLRLENKVIELLK